MKKQYMDFVPAKKKPVDAVKKQPVKKAANSKVVKASTKASGSVKNPAAKVTQKVSFTGEKKPKLGKVENLNTRFVKSDVPKRPLSRKAHFTTAKTGVAAAKAQKVSLKDAVAKPVKKPVEKSVENSKVAGVYQTPKNPFINQGKVSKRPLSKNVYAKKVVALTEEPQGPVTIISKPEKQAHVGLIVTIILAIILGAAAGTVAFLLLPK